MAPEMLERISSGERERDGGRTRVRWIERIYAPVITKKTVRTRVYG